MKEPTMVKQFDDNYGPNIKMFYTTSPIKDINLMVEYSGKVIKIVVTSISVVEAAIILTGIYHKNSNFSKELKNVFGLKDELNKVTVKYNLFGNDNFLAPSFSSDYLCKQLFKEQEAMQIKKAMKA